MGLPFIALEIGAWLSLLSLIKRLRPIADHLILSDVSATASACPLLINKNIRVDHARVFALLPTSVRFLSYGNYLPGVNRRSLQKTMCRRRTGRAVGSQRFHLGPSEIFARRRMRKDSASTCLYALKMGGIGDLTTIHRPGG